MNQGSSPRGNRRRRVAAGRALAAPGRSGREFIRRQPAVHQRHHAVGAGGELRVVGDGDHRGVAVVDQLAQDGAHVLAAGAVEVAGRLVGQDQQRPVGQRTGDGHALALPAADLVRLLVRVAGQAEPFEQLQRARRLLGVGQPRQAAHRQAPRCPAG
jgi:hypothetical protein